MIEIAVLLLLNIFLSVRYAKLDVDPDFAAFTMWGITGAKYGKDFVDCKTPLVHLWFLLLSRIKCQIEALRGIHVFVTGLPALIYFAFTKDFAGALAFLVLVHSGWLLSFHGNIGDLPAGMIFIALFTPNPWLKVALLILATLYEPKLIVATGAVVVIGAYWLPGLVLSGVVGVALFCIWYFRHDVWEWVVESSFTIPYRMTKYRKGLYKWFPIATSIALLYITPWIIAGIFSRPDILYWTPPLLYVVLSFMGKIVRQNHFIPVIPWIALSGIKPEIVYALAVTDFLSAGFYFGDIWVRFYVGLAGLIKEAKSVGLWLRDKPGVLWVNTMHVEIYTVAKKKPAYGMMELVEVNHVAKERRSKMLRRIGATPPDWIVVANDTNIEYDYSPYSVVAKTLNFLVYKRNGYDYTV